MKKERIIVIISGALLAVAAMIGIKKYRDKKSEKDTSEEKEDSEVSSEIQEQNQNKGGGGGGGTTNTAPVGMTWNAACNRYNGSTAFAIRVKQVQKEIGITGCDVDGLVGNQTNKALKDKYPNTFIVYGNLSESNIEQYLGGKFEKGYESQKSGANFMSNWVSNLLNKGIAISNRDDIPVYIVTWDAANQKFVKTGASNNMNMGVTINADQYQAPIRGNDLGQFTNAHYAIFKLKASQLTNATGGDRFGAIYVGYLNV